MHALVLAGGGSRGAFEVGVVKRLVADGSRTYDILTGVSVGALNAAWLAQFPKGAEVEAAASLEKLWLGIETRNVRRDWPLFGKLAALWKRSVYDSSPLHDLVRKRLDLDRIRRSGRAVAVGAVSLDTGRYRVFRPEEGDRFVKGVLASSAFPAMLTPVEIDGELWSDGGLRNITPLKAAIELGATRCDVVIPAPRDLAPQKGRYDTVRVGVRSLDIMLNEIQLTDLDVATRVNELVRANRAAKGKRDIDLTLILPEDALDMDLLVFDPEKSRELIRKGFEAADKVLRTQVRPPAPPPPPPPPPRAQPQPSA